MRTLVTGGAGFIGSHIVDALLQRGRDVRVFDDLSTGSLDNLSTSLDHIEFVEGDLRDSQRVSDATQGCDAVLHLAALGSVPRSLADPSTSHDVNVTGTVNVLKGVKRNGVGTVIYSSSSSVYGDSAFVEKEEHQPLNPISPYGASKLSAEAYCLAFARSFGFDAIALRYFNVFGPRQNPEGAYAAVIPKFIMGALERNPWTINGDGKHARDFTYVSNVVEANIQALERASATDPVAVNVACGDSVSLLDLSETVSELAGAQDVQPIFGPERPGDIVRSLADIALAREILDYEVLVDWRTGLSRTLDWYASRIVTSD